MAILVVLLASLALGRPVVAPEDGHSGGVVVVIDRSASMATVDADGQTRLEAAVNAVGERIAGLDPSTAVTLIAYDRQPTILVPRTVDRQAVNEALAELTGRGQLQMILRLPSAWPMTLPD